jgi:MFS family permease
MLQNGRQPKKIFGTAIYDYIKIRLSINPNPETLSSMLYSRTFLILALANFFTMSSISAFYLFPLFITRHGGSKADIGILMAVFSIASILTRPWISEMIDRLGRKRCYTLACLILSFMPLVHLFFKGSLSSFYVPLIFVRFIHGIGLALAFTAVLTYIADIVPKNRLNEGLGMFGVTALVGLAVGPIIAELVIRHFSFPVFFIMSSLLAIIGLVLHLPLAESYVFDNSGRPSQSFFSILLNKRRIFIVLLAFSFGFGLSSVFGFLTPFAEEKQLTFISLFFITYSAGAVSMRFFGGRLADKVGESRIIPHAFVITGFGLMMLVFLGGDLILILSGAICGLGHGLLYPCLNAIAIRDEPRDIRGKIIGIFTGGIDTGVFSGSILLGYIGNWFGYPVLFLVAGLVLLMGCGLYRFRATWGYA